MNLTSILSPNRPERRTPMHNNENPTVNWLSFPIVGMKGLPMALSQTPCNEDSIRVNYVEVIMDLMFEKS